MVSAMPKSFSNREALEKALLDLATEFLAKPSGLLYELEQFLELQGISSKRYQNKRERTIEFSGQRWEILGFSSEQEMKDFENRSDFPGWDAL